MDSAVVVVYFAVMLGAAYWGYQRAKTADDYLVAGRRLGHPMFIGTLSAVVLGGASTIRSGPVLNSLLGVSTTAAILIAGGVVVLYCVTGGMWSLTLTDIVQFAI